jgi:hypothetical protein
MKLRNLNKYGEFIVEKLILEQLLLESNVVYSSKFKKALAKMPENEIAKKLLEIENKDLEVVSNFFDIKIDNDNILTFTPDRVAQGVLNDTKEYVTYQGARGGWLTNNVEQNGGIFEKLGFTPKTEKVYFPNNVEFGEIISKVKSEKSGKTWCYVKFPNGEGVYNEEKLRTKDIDKASMIFSKSRQEVRIGRAVRVLLQAYKYPIVDADIETFVNDFRSVLSIMNDVFSRFEIVEGDDLGFWYHKKNYEFPQMGMLGSSCQAVGNLKWLQIYIDNPEAVKLLILKSENDDSKIIGRALLWTLDDGGVVMDQIYTSKDSDRNVFIEYGNSKGYHQMNWSTSFVAHLKPGKFEQYPSVDNMNNWDPETGKISNKEFPGSRRIIWSEHDDDDDDWDDDDWDDDDNDDN